MRTRPSPPHWAKRLLARLHPDDTLEEVEGDLDELYAYWYDRAGKTQATLRYVLNVVSVLPPFVRRRERKQAYYQQPSSLNPDMLRNYFKIAWRNLVRNKVYSSINIAGLAVGFTVVTLIALWIQDELTFNMYHKRYNSLAQVYQFQTANGQIYTQGAVPIPLRSTLATDYGTDFESMSLSSWERDHVLAHGDKKFTKTGCFVEPTFPEMMTIQMHWGTRNGLVDPSSILLAESAAQALFGSVNPIGQIVRMDNKTALRVSGVYKDLPKNSHFHAVTFLAPWSLFVSLNDWVKRSGTQWGNNSFQLFAQLPPGTDMARLSAKIKNSKARHAPAGDAQFKPEIWLHPMSQWHLHSEWQNGVPISGRAQFVTLFGLIGGFVLLLACINFINLTTARAEKRTREVGIRKAIGSERQQLIGQFFLDSLLVTCIAAALGIIAVQLLLPAFNELTAKRIMLPLQSPRTGLIGIVFILLTSLLAGSYPALYISGLRPVEALKGRITVGRWAFLPRQTLIVIQFAVSITLIIGTLVVYQQIQHAKNRPIGYDQEQLLSVLINTQELRGHYDALRSDLLRTGVVANMAESSSPPTDVWATSANFDWPGRSNALTGDFATVATTHDYGNTIRWRIKEGRGFSRAFPTDSLGMILNESAVKFMGLKNPLGLSVKHEGRTYTVIGVVEDLLMQSPFKLVYQTVFMLDYQSANTILVRLNPQADIQDALTRVGAVFQKYNPGSPFDYSFVEDINERKFQDEERIGRLAQLFAGLAIFISCLGLFGLATFMAESRTKEIGVRKVLGASTINLWGLLSRDFVMLVVIAFFIATPIAYYFFSGWLQKYDYRTDISWWIFAVSGAGALFITLLTVSFQSIKAALMNPVKSLRNE